jgi:hypothetical protein
MTRDAFFKKLEERGFPFAARRERFLAHAGELSAGETAEAIGFAAAKENPAEYVAQGAALVAKPLGARTSIPWSRVASVQFAAPVVIPAGAWILVENEAPGAYAWVLAVDGLLVVFLLFNVLMLVVVLRRRRAAIEAEPAPTAP